MLRKRFQKDLLTASVERGRRILAIVLLCFPLYKRGSVRR